ncbi:MAG: hypothetical protein KZQ78_13880 [Candidatus Thiodiazotropha sp. (ex Ustalcina ferruginea)]|nr:hypothetical protein [Candidatus Thiodiazotropha sp. (ex Ustalcina ferruginea)]
MNCVFIQQQSGLFPTTLLCRVINVARSTYNNWKKRGPKMIPLKQMALRQNLILLFMAS